MTTATLGIAVSSNADKAAVDLDRLTASAAKAEAGVVQLAGAAERTHAATGQMAINSANVAAQLQDVFVSAQMGMSPLQVALQQGTQLSAALGNSGLKGTVSALGGAFASILSPVSLATIAIIGLGTFGMQALGGIANGADSVTSALEKHDAWLDRVLLGYDDVREAAEKAAEEALRLPSQSAALEAGGGQADALRAYEEQLNRLLSFNRAIRLEQEAYPAFANQYQELDRLLGLLRSGNTTVADFDTALREIKFSESAPARVREFLADLIQAAENARQLEANLKGASTAAEQFSADAIINATFGMLNGQTDAIAALKRMTPDLRSKSERAQDIYDQNSGSDASGDLKKQLDFTLQQIDAEERLAATRKAGRAATKDIDQWGTATENFQKRIDQAQVEIELFGKSTYELEKQRAATDLLAEAKQAGILIDDEVRASINALAEDWATAQVQLEGLHVALENRSPWEALEENLARLAELRDADAIGWETYSRAVARSTAETASSALGSAANLLGAADQAFGGLKELSVAVAVLKGAESVASAFAEGTKWGGPLLGTLYAGVAFATAAANVATVMGVGPKSKSLNSPTQSGSTANAQASAAPAQQPQQQGMNITLQGTSFGRDQVRELLEQIADYQRDGGMTGGITVSAA